MSFTYLVSYDITDSDNGNDNKNFRSFINDLFDSLLEEDKNEFRENEIYDHLVGNLLYGEFTEVETAFWVELMGCLDQKNFTLWLKALVHCFNVGRVIEGNPKIKFVFIANSDNYPLGEVEPMPLRQRR